MTAANSLEPAAVQTGDRDKAASSCARVAEQEGDTPLVFAARINRTPALMHKAGRFPAGGGEIRQNPHRGRISCRPPGRDEARQKRGLFGR